MAAHGPGTVPAADVSGEKRQPAGIEPRAALQIAPLGALTSASAAGRNTPWTLPGRNTVPTAPMRPSERWIAEPHGPGTRPTRRLTTHPGMKSAEKNARRIQSWFGQKNELPVPNENLKHNHPAAPSGAVLFTFLLRATPFPVVSCNELLCRIFFAVPARGGVIR